MNFDERVRRKNEFDASIVYGTGVFNKLTGRDSLLNEREKNDDQWLNETTGIVDQKYTEPRTCPLCGNDISTTLFIKSGFPHVKCSSCQLVYVNQMLTEKEYEKLYSTESEWANILQNEHQIKMQTLESNYSLDIVELYLDKTTLTAICDIGCGPGTLLNEAKKRGYDVLGIEPNSNYHSALKEKEIEYVGEYFPLKTEVPQKFDCMFLLNVLEHMRNPIEVVLYAKKILKKNGLIYISVPCIDALVNRIMHEKAGAFGGHSHLQLFGIETIQTFLKKTGFEILEYETIITELGVIHNYLHYENPYFGEIREMFNFLSPEIIYKNHLARNVNIVGRIQ